MRIPLAKALHSTQPWTPASKHAPEPPRTRGKRMQAARVVMGQKGIAGTAINEITAEAGTALFDEKVTGEVFCSPERARVVGVLSPCRANVNQVPGGYLIEESV
ncbi:hypothetical protein F4827_004718 [Paraburkholderia bannensis]|uniref:Uncharacterized protein n=1 Tax=Paraburkholderia bannensis TaxID=765414 RepID=A0A7W9U0K2_9BURK|nr:MULTISPECIES: hypothetical protein [Paraburkholderia]MBB3259837.1 hypothetical protein [Paraburkholderia sp. WP4_3_2]MBB6104853.1 hypothetical protein [Paraburkholderia bannensis]